MGLTILVRKMLQVNPAERVGIEEVVDNAWFGDVREEEMED